MSNSSLVNRLTTDLQNESHTRQLQQDVNSKLQKEHDHLLKRLAEAENHIDQLRLGGSVTLNKHFVITHETLRDRLGSQLDPSWRVLPRPVSDVHPDTNGSHVQPTSQASHSTTNACTVTEHIWNDKQHSEHHGSLGGGDSTLNILDLERENEQSPLHHTLSVRDLDPSPPPTAHMDRPHPLASSDLSNDDDDPCISQMSASSVTNRANAESLQIAHIFKIGDLQEKVADLQMKLNEGGISFDTLMSNLEQIQQEHRVLKEEVEDSNTRLEALNKRYKGQASGHIARSKNAIGNELATLADQLKSLQELLHSKAKQLETITPPPSSPLHTVTSPSDRGHASAPPLPASSATESDLHAQMTVQSHDSGSEASSEFSYDPQTSPYLPSKYFTKNVTKHSSTLNDSVGDIDRSPEHYLMSHDHSGEHSLSHDCHSLSHDQESSSTASHSERETSRYSSAKHVYSRASSLPSQAATPDHTHMVPHSKANETHVVQNGRPLKLQAQDQYTPRQAVSNTSSTRHSHIPRAKPITRIPRPQDMIDDKAEHQFQVPSHEQLSHVHPQRPSQTHFRTEDHHPHTHVGLQPLHHHTSPPHTHYPHTCTSGSSPSHTHTTSSDHETRRRQTKPSDADSGLVRSTSSLNGKGLDGSRESYGNRKEDYSSLTMSAIDRLRAELDSLKEQIMKSQPSNTSSYDSYGSRKTPPRTHSTLSYSSHKSPPHTHSTHSYGSHKTPPHTHSTHSYSSHKSPPHTHSTHSYSSHKSPPHAHSVHSYGSHKTPPHTHSTHSYGSHKSPPHTHSTHSYGSHKSPPPAESYNTHTYSSVSRPNTIHSTSPSPIYYTTSPSSTVPQVLASPGRNVHKEKVTHYSIHSASTSPNHIPPWHYSTPTVSNSVRSTPQITPSHKTTVGSKLGTPHATPQTTPDHTRYVAGSKMTTPQTTPNRNGVYSTRPVSKTTPHQANKYTSRSNTGDYVMPTRSTPRHTQSTTSSAVSTPHRVAWKIDSYPSRHSTDRFTSGHSPSHSHTQTRESAEFKSPKHHPRLSGHQPNSSTSTNCSGLEKSKDHSRTSKSSSLRITRDSDWVCPQCGGKGTTTVSTSPSGTHTHVHTHKCTQVYTSPVHIQSTDKRDHGVQVDITRGDYFTARHTHDSRKEEYTPGGNVEPPSFARQNPVATSTPAKTGREESEETTTGHFNRPISSRQGQSSFAPSQTHTPVHGPHTGTTRLRNWSSIDRDNHPLTSAGSTPHRVVRHTHFDTGCSPYREVQHDHDLQSRGTQYGSPAPVNSRQLLTNTKRLSTNGHTRGMHSSYASPRERGEGVYVHGPSQEREITPRERVVYVSGSPSDREEIYHSEPVPRCRDYHRDSHRERKERKVIVKRSGSRRRKVYVRPESRQKVYVVGGGYSDSDSEPDLKVVEGPGLDLNEALRLARNLKRRSRKMHGSLRELIKIHNH